jgi:hypothetical protein
MYIAAIIQSYEKVAIAIGMAYSEHFFHPGSIPEEVKTGNRRR